MLQFCFRNQVTDLSDAPLYCEVGQGFVINRLNRMVMTKSSLVAAMTASGYTPKANEIGPAPFWEAVNVGWWSQDSFCTPVEKQVIHLAAQPTSSAVNITPTFSGVSTYDINWGDGTVDKNKTGQVTHTYAAPFTGDVKLLACV